MKVKFRTGFWDYEEIDLTEEQVVDLLDFVLNGERGFDGAGSTLTNNQILLAALKAGRLDCQFYEEYRHALFMQK